MAQFGEEELISLVKCIIEGILVGHHDRTRAISYIIKSGIVRGKSQTRQTLNDAWESTIRKICSATLGIVGCIQPSWKRN